MDGLLIDSERIAQQCCIQAGLDLGFAIDEALARTFLGVTKEGCIQILKNEFPAINSEIFYQHSHHLFDSMLSENLTTKPGAVELLKHLTQTGFPFALASSSSQQRVNKSLRLTNIASFFPERIRITSEKALHSKPEPDLFLAAASCISVAPKNCLVLEDSENGIKSGRSAGCIVCMIPDLIPFSDKLEQWCDFVADDLYDVLSFISTHNLTRKTPE